MIDHLERGRIDLSALEVLLLDEADRMLDMGFVDDVERIALLAPKSRQTVLSRQPSTVPSRGCPPA